MSSFLRASPPTALRSSRTPINLRRKLPWEKLDLSSSSSIPASSHRAASVRSSAASASSSVVARGPPADSRPAVVVKENPELVSGTELCGELGEEDVGRRVRLCGWVVLHMIHDGRTLLNLRDPSGVVQITVLPDQYPDAYATVNKVRTEYVVSIEGVVQCCPSESSNKKMKVGTIEVMAERIQVLNSVNHERPFYVTSADDAKERATEEIRLRYKTIVGAKQANPPVMPAVMTPMGPLDLSSVLFRNRIIFIGQPVNSQVAQRVISQLVTLASIDEDADILIYINCPGGSTYSVLAIYDTMSWIKPKVGTVCFGVAASQGALLLAGGEKGMRYAMPNARIMIHQPQSGCGGHVEDVRRQVNEAVQSRHKIDKMYAAFTGQSLDKVQQYTERDRFLSSAEALDFGLVDGILETEY